MASLDADGLARTIGRGRRGGVYFLHGEEEFLKEEAVTAIVAAHLDPATRDFNLDLLRGASLDPETLASICNTPPMMAEWRVVVVRDAQYLAASARMRAVIESIVDSPVPALALVLVATIGASKAKFYGELERKTTAVAFAPLPSGDLPDWLIQRADSAGVELEPKAARALAAAAGPTLGALVRELDKLIDFAADRRAIRAEDVARLVGHVPSVNRWDWIDTVAERRIAEARAQLPVLLENGDSGVGLVIALGTQFLRLGVAVAGGQAALADALPPNQRFLARRVIGQARRWSLPDIEAAVADLLRADRLLKSSGAGDRHVLEELLLRLQARRAAA